MTVDSRRVKFLTAVAMAWLVGSGPAAAETVREALDGFGFSGTWALRCDDPPSPDNNVRVVSVSPGGDPMFAESLGPESDPNIYVIVRARRVNDDTIVLRVKLNGEIDQDLTIQRDKNRIRTMDNREIATGQYVVKNGVVASNKRETPWLTHCPQKPD
jgi:hypothetical protein